MVHIFQDNSDISANQRTMLNRDNPRVDFKINLEEHIIHWCRAYRTHTITTALQQPCPYAWSATAICKMV